MSSRRKREVEMGSHKSPIKRQISSNVSHGSKNSPRNAQGLNLVQGRSAHSQHQHETFKSSTEHKSQQATIRGPEVTQAIQEQMMKT